VDVLDRHGEDQLPAQVAEPAEQAREEFLPARADDVVAVIDLREQGVEMLLSPALARGGHEHQRFQGPFEPAPERLAPAVFLAGHDHRLDRAATRGDQLFQRTSHLVDRGVNDRSKNHHPDAGSRQRIAPGVGFERVGELASGRRHPASRRFAQTRCGASQRSTAAQ
jgi:hypothetical protein